MDFGNNPEISHELTRIWRGIFLNKSAPPGSILITSSLSGEGKTTAAINLAKFNAAAESNRKTLLVEGNFRNPAIQDYFDLPNSHGLTDVILRDVPLKKAAQITPIPNLHIIGAGAGGLGFIPFDKIGNIKGLLKDAKKEFDVIIFDALPVLESPETGLIFRHFDGILLIIQANRTVRPDVERAKQEILESGGNILGTILNRKKQYITTKI